MRSDGHWFQSHSGRSETLAEPADAADRDSTCAAIIANARADDFWNRVHPNPKWHSLFSSRRWIDVLGDTYGLNILASARLDREGWIKSAILFSHVSDIRGDRIICLPFSDYCDPWVDDFASWQTLITPILKRRVPCRLRCLRNDLPENDSRFALTKTAKWHATDLTQSEDKLWTALSSSARQNIRRAAHSGVVVRVGRSIADIDSFHRLHVRLRKMKYGMLAQPAAMFRRMHARFAVDDALTVLIAEANGVPIAGVILLQCADILYYKFNASSEQHLRPNDILIWNAILYGHRNGMKLLDFGLSAGDHPGLIRYKRKFATDERNIQFFEWCPDECVDIRAEQTSEVLDRVTRLLTHPTVPDEITRAAGEQLYRFFA